jgi:hypothetical protein
MRRGALLALLGLLLVAVGVGVFRLRGVAPSPAPPPVTLGPPQLASPQPASPLDEPKLKAQIQTITESMARTGHPPKGIPRGGRGKNRGTFLNSEGKLPAEPRGYYTETDVWPRGPNGRGPERLVFGKGGEVYFSPDHYKTFLRVK